MNYIFLVPTKIEYSSVISSVQNNYSHLLKSKRFKIIQASFGEKIFNYIKSNLNLLKNNEIILTGTAGALSNTLSFGDIITPKAFVKEDKEIIALSCSKTYNIDIKKVIMFTCAKLIQGILAKKTISDKYSADVVDMESYYAFVACKKYKLNLQIVKVILDEYNESIRGENNSFAIIRSISKNLNLNNDGHTLFLQRIKEAGVIIANIINSICM